MFYKLRYWFSDQWRGRLVNKHHIVKTGLPVRAWYDTDTRLLYSIMALLTEFVEKEAPLDGKPDFVEVDWDSDDGHKHARAEMIEIYKWWKNYDNRMDEIDNTRMAWHNRVRSHMKNDDLREYFGNMRIFEKEDPEIRILFNKTTELEEKLEKEEEDMMIRVIKIREYLWT